MIRRVLASIALLILGSCSRPNVYRMVNLSGGPLLVHDVGKNDVWTLAAGETSRRLLLSDGRRYELSRAAEPACRYTYATLAGKTVPIPEGRRLVDGGAPRAVTLVTVDGDFVVRAYPYAHGGAIDPASEFRVGGFPARLSRTCKAAS